MKIETYVSRPKVMTDCTTLHSLIDRIAGSLSPAIFNSKSILINAVPEEICVRNDEELVASVLSELINLVINHTQNSRIRITAKLYGNVVLLHVKDDGCLNYDSISHNLTRIQSLAEKVGGFIGFTSYRNRLTTIAFSFMNVAEAA